MIKKALNRGVLPVEFDDSERKFSALLNSSFTQKLLDEQELKLRASREEYAASLKKLLAHELEQIQVLDQTVEDDLKGLAGARELLHVAEIKLTGSINARDGFRAKCLVERTFYEKELKRSAPLIEEAISSLYKLLEDNQDLRSSTALISSKQDIRGFRTTVTSSDFLSMSSFIPAVSAAIRELEDLKLEPDHFQFPKKISEILAKVPDPKNFKVNMITRDEAAGTEKIEDMRL